MSKPETASPSTSDSQPLKSKAQRWAVGCGSLLFLLLLSASLAVRFWRFESSEDFSTPARPPTQPIYDPGPGMPREFDQVVAVPQVGEAGWNRKGSLAWEIVRQGVLVAAEQELGLPTLDPSFGQQIPFVNSPQSFPVIVQMLASSRTHPDSKPQGPILPAQHYFSIEISRGRPTGPAFRWAAPDVVFPQDRLYESLAENIDSLASGPLIQALAAAGFSKAAPATRETSDAGDDPQIPDRMDLVSQFTRLRFYHSHLVAQGESAEALQSLIKAYANLGSLTDFHWSATSKACKARALVYSQRLRRKFGDTAANRAHEAYALALIGRHHSALDSAAQIPRDAKSGLPEWLGMIEAYCRYEPDQLATIDGPQRELACYLRMRMFEIVNDQDRTLQAVDQFQQTNQACGRATELLAEADSLSVKQLLASKHYPSLWSAVYQRLASTPDLPASVRDFAMTAQRPAADADADAEYSARENLIASLRKSSTDTAPARTPSWAVLGELLSDESFLQAWRMVDVAANWLKIDPEQLLSDLSPLYKGHRHSLFLQGYASDRQQAQADLQQFLKTLDKTTLDSTAIPIARELVKTLGYRIGQPFGTLLNTHDDDLYEDLGPKYAWDLLQYGPGKRLFDISPHWPLSVAAKIRSDGEHNIDSVDELAETARPFPAILNALGTRYLEMSRIPDAIRAYEKSIAVAPGFPACRALASLYREEGNYEKWSQTLEQALVINGNAKDAAQVHTDLADSYMRHAAWDKAEPHVTPLLIEATETGFQLAARCAEGQEKWGQAESFVRELSKRFPECANDWYLWCSRTGHGDQDAALAFANRMGNAATVQASPKMYWTLATRQILTGNAPLAELTLRDAHFHLGNTLSGNLAAVLYDARDKTAERDALLVQVGQSWIPPEGYPFDQENPALRGRRKKDPFPELTNLMMVMLADGQWNANDFELHIVESERGASPSLYLVAGMFLCHHDQKELGHEYLQRAISYPTLHRFMGALAAHTLRQDGVEIRKPQRRETPDSIAPLAAMVKRFMYHYQRNNLDRAEKAIDELHAAAPQFLPGLMARGQYFEARGQYAEAIAVYDEALRIDPNYSRAHYRLAWLLSDCDVAEFRNGARALSHANRFVSLRRLPTYASVSTLAVAFAESGNLPMAIQMETQALTLPGILNDVSQQLSIYKSGQPYRRLPPKRRYPDPRELDVAGHDL